jgi:topoisomerase-4 subunit A
VIRIIRHEDEPKAMLMKKFKLSDEQAEAILELKLRHLAKLEETKITGEQKELAKEKADIEKTLGSPDRMKTLIKKELQRAMDEFGDKRRSPIVTRQEAAAIDLTEMTPAEPVTVVLSDKGWIRSAKGHELDPTTLSYKAGDAYKASVKGKSNQQAIFIDADGRTFSILASTLPSARGQGEPLTGRVKSQASSFDAVVMGNDDDKVVLATDAGYGFIVKLSELVSKNKSGKSVIKVPEKGHVLSVCPVQDAKKDVLVAVTNIGHLLMFPVSELPELAKGKGNKIINIPTAKYDTREEFVVDIAVLMGNAELKLHSGQRSMILKKKDLENYVGSRGARGNKLPRGYQQVTCLEVV